MPATLSATTASSRVIAGEFNAPRQVVANDGPADAYVACGTVAVVATVAGSTFVKAGTIASFGTNLGAAAYIAGITAAGTAALRISSPGAGAQYNAGPTGAQG